MNFAKELRALQERSAKLSEVEYQKAVKRLIFIDIAAAYSKHMGYDFPPERIESIAEEARFAMSEGVPANYAYAHALSTEIAINGDPNDKTNYSGVLGQHRFREHNNTRWIWEELKK